MTRFLVIDDEPIIRSGIKNKILKLIPEADVVGEAEDGEEALKKTEALKPDIIITDIKMPKLDGLLFIESAIKASPNSFFIIVSGYQEFAYAQKALRMGVYDYLLKPVNNDDLKNSVVQLIEKIEKRRKQIAYLSELSDNNHGDARRELQSLAIRLMMKSTELSVDEQNIIPSPSDSFVIATIRVITKHFYDGDGVKSDISHVKQIIFDTIPTSVVCNSLNNRDDECILLVHSLKKNEQYQKKFMDIIDKAKEILELDIVIGLGEPIAKFEKLKQSYDESQQAIEDIIAFHNRSFTSFQHSQLLAKNNYYIKENVKEILVETIQLRDFEQAKLIISSIYNDIKQAKLPYLRTNEISIELILMFIDILSKQNALVSASLNNTKIDLLFKYCVYYEDFEETVINRLQRVCQIIGQDDTETGEDIVRQIISTIEDAFYKELKLSDFAEMYFINPSYLSQLFLKKTGVNFKRYLIDTRIKKAKEMLVNTEFTISKIAEFIGVSDRNYFSKMFSRYEGVSPAVYRKQNKEQ